MTPVLVLRPPRTRWHRIGFVAVCCYAVGQLILMLWPPLAWRMLPLAAMGFVYAVWASTWWRVSVEVRLSGLTVNHGGLRRRGCRRRPGRSPSGDDHPAEHLSDRDEIEHSPSRLRLRLSRE